jgi:hypothetical protein
MTAQTNKTPPALKHAGFSRTNILPGEDPSELEKLHRGLVSELNLNGALEDEIGSSLAHHLWRKRNLGIYGVAARAQQRMNEIYDELLTSFTSNTAKSDGMAESTKIFQQKWQAAKARAREELGESYDFVEMGEEATLDGLAKLLAIQDRLDAMIYRELKKLLLVRGLKSMAIEPNPVPRERL